MNEKDFGTDVGRVLRLAGLLWLLYDLGLALIDTVFYPAPVYPPRYYLINGLNALIALGLAVWPFPGRRLGRWFLPVMIGVMSVLPVVTNQLLVLPLPPGPHAMPETTTLRLMPVLFLALVLVAWQYRWPDVLGFSLGLAGLNLVLLLVLYRSGHPFLPPLVVTIIQTVSFLVVGYFVSRLMTRLRSQQAALETANARLVDYAAALEDLTISRERNRLARELHDTLAHTLSAISVQMETIKAYWDLDPAAAQAMLDTSLAATRSGLQETRRALKSLRASPLEDLGLVLALGRLADETAARAHLQLHLALPERLPSLAPRVEQVVYRVAQEAIANVAHHANARNLTVELVQDQAGLSLLVRDDGLGFDPGSGADTGHYGLSGMRERAALADGRLEVESRPGQGTSIRLTIEDGEYARTDL